jgi:hypothetical protein
VLVLAVGLAVVPENAFPEHGTGLVPVAPLEARRFEEELAQGVARRLERGPACRVRRHGPAQDRRHVRQVCQVLMK